MVKNNICKDIETNIRKEYIELFSLAKVFDVDEFEHYIMTEIDICEQIFKYDDETVNKELKAYYNNRLYFLDELLEKYEALKETKQVKNEIEISLETIDNTILKQSLEVIIKKTKITFEELVKKLKTEAGSFSGLYIHLKQLKSLNNFLFEVI